MRPPHANPAPEGAGAYAMPPYYLWRSADMSTGNTTLSRTGGCHKRAGAKARIAGDLKERSYKSHSGFLLSQFFVLVFRSMPVTDGPIAPVW
jgi:hypothetical protein